MIMKQEEITIRKLKAVHEHQQWAKWDKEIEGLLFH